MPNLDDGFPRGDTRLAALFRAIAHYGLTLRPAEGDKRKFARECSRGSTRFRQYRRRSGGRRGRHTSTARLIGTRDDRVGCPLMATTSIRREGARLATRRREFQREGGTAESVSSDRSCRRFQTLRPRRAARGPGDSLRGVFLDEMGLSPRGAHPRSPLDVLLSAIIARVATGSLARRAPASPPTMVTLHVTLTPALASGAG